MLRRAAAAAARAAAQPRAAAALERPAGLELPARGLAQASCSGRELPRRAAASAAGRPLPDSALPSATAAVDPRLSAPRERLSYDVVIVGAGPAGLSAAIRLKALAAQRQRPVSVAVVEKAAALGNHTLSGCILDPRGLDGLLGPNWRSASGCPVRTPVTHDRVRFLLSPTRSLPLPTPPPLRNTRTHGGPANYIVSLSAVVRWLGAQAEALGVDVLLGAAASELLISSSGAVEGIATGDVGLNAAGLPKPGFSRGVDLAARATLLAEGARGSLTQLAIKRFGLDAGRGPQTYGLGVKEVWEVPADLHRPGEALHTLGWPLAHRGATGGGFLYHLGDELGISRPLVAVGLVTGLDYSNPWLSPYHEFQRFKSHPLIRRVLEGGTLVEYGARVLAEGGAPARPLLIFPGGALVGCGAGLLNFAQLKGAHNAIESGRLAAEACFEALLRGQHEELDAPLDLSAYPAAFEASWAGRELHAARNVRPGFARFGLALGMVHAGLDAYVMCGRLPYTLTMPCEDHEATEPASKHARIHYPPPDGRLTFAIADALFRSAIDHEHDSPSHLRLRDPALPAEVNLPVYGGPEAYYCPAAVYEYEREGGAPDARSRLRIHAANCVHCKTCDLKDPRANIVWTPPEGGSGPRYTLM